MGIVNGKAVLDLDYQMDVNAEVDMNIVMTEQGGFIELQGTAEQQAFHQQELQNMLQLAQNGINQLFDIQRAALEEK